MTTPQKRLLALKERLSLVEHIDFEEPLHDDDIAFVREVKEVLAKRPLTLDELADLRKPHKDKAAAKQSAEWNRIVLQRTAGNHNKLFSVANRSEMRIDVIAMDVATAQEFAARSGHVRSADNATAFLYNDGHVQKLLKDGSALGRAMREGVPGVVEKRVNNVIVGDRVFTPMTAV